MQPDGVFLSNGPGDPASMNREVEQIKELVSSSMPTFGICFGHQLLGRAFGGTTFKLVFGHRGGNQPVKDMQEGGVEITSHNHGFAVKADSLPVDVEITHLNLNDLCVRSLLSLRCFCGWFHFPFLRLSRSYHTGDTRFDNFA